MATVVTVIIASGPSCPQWRWEWGESGVEGGMRSGVECGEWLSGLHRERRAECEVWRLESGDWSSEWGVEWRRESGEGRVEREELRADWILRMACGACVESGMEWK